MKPSISRLALAASILSSFGVDPTPEAVSTDYNGFENGRILAYNASQFSSNNPSEFLSNYAVRYTDPAQAQIASIRNFLAPDVRGNMSQTVQYAVYGLGDSYLALDNSGDDQRSIGADFATLRNPAKTLTTQIIPNRGLAIEVDEDEEILDPDWQQQKVAQLRGILDRTELRRAVALFVAGAAGVAKTWDTTAGKDPDQDLLTELDAAAIRPNRIIFGPGAATKRKLAHRAQNTAGGYASAGLSDDEIAGFLNIESVQTVRSRYSTTASATSPVVGSVALLFIAGDNLGRNDFSNMKTFWRPCKNGQRYSVTIRQVGDKRWRVAVEKYDLVALTSTVAAEVITVS